VTHVYISAPTHHSPEIGFVGSIMHAISALGKAGVSYSFEMPGGESMITRARNNAVARFLKSPATHLFFIDSDQTFDADDVLRMIACGHDLVGALIPMKQLETAYVFNAETGTFRPDEHGCVPAAAVGTGFMLVARRVIEEMIKKHPETRYLTDHTPNGQGAREERHALFDCGVVGDRYLTEDYYFCHRAKGMGVQPMLNLHVHSIGHIGVHLFKGDVVGWLQQFKDDAA